MTSVDVLVPTYGRPAALAATLATVAAQTVPGLRLVVSDQTEGDLGGLGAEARAVLRLLAARGHQVEVHRHLPRRGLAEHRQFLLSQTRAPYALFLDDDVLIEPDLVERLLTAIGTERCGFVGSAVLGLSYDGDVRPEEEHIELWDGPVMPEDVRPGTPAWDRYRLHNAANLWHVQRRLGIPTERQRVYKVAWVGGCVLYDVDKLRRAGGYAFWSDLPPSHCGEDVLAQLRVMARFGGCGLIPSGAYHQEIPTTVPDRAADAPLLLR
ncbi:MAG TPA: glycosyltransferase [Acidimicrobiales bacterium]|jgi:GT2 family glycosyltransferase|nr:glycosyltransferase [Acidimicrobiales bacterium]